MTRGRMRGEHEFIWPNGAIMEPLCSVKSHEITTATSESVQYTAERELRVGGGLNSALDLVASDGSQFFFLLLSLFLRLRQLWELKGISIFLGWRQTERVLMQPALVGSLSARFLCNSLMKSVFWNPIMFVRQPPIQERRLFCVRIKAAKRLSGRLTSRK